MFSRSADWVNHRVWGWLAVLAGIALLVALAALLRAPGEAPAQSVSDVGATVASPGGGAAGVEVVPESNRIAVGVLPFANMSADPDNEYFSDGISEQILDALVKTGTVDVIARTSSFQFKGQNLPVQEIANTLNVSHLVEGSVRKAGNRVRVTAQLINAANGVHLWSETFDRELVDIFAMQDEIANRIVAEISRRLGDDPWNPEKLKSQGFKLPERHGVHPEAYEYYLRAQHNRSVARNWEEFRRSEDLFARAVELDPRFGAAWLELARGKWLNPYDSNRNKATQALAALERALVLEPKNTSALTLMGIIQAFVNFRWQEGEAMIRKAVELEPSNAGARTALGVLLGLTNRRLESLREHERAYRLDPLNVSVVVNYVDRLTFSARVRDAARVSATIAGLVEHSMEVPLMVDFYLRTRDPETAARYLDVLRNQIGADSARVITRERWLADLRGDAETVARLDEAIWDRVERGDYVPIFSWGDDRMEERVSIGVRNREYETAFVLLAFSGNWAEPYRREMNLENFEVRASHVASDAEKAELEKRRVSLSRNQLNQVSGLYLSEKDGWIHRFEREGERLIIDVPQDNYRGEAVPVSANHFINGCCVVWEYEFGTDDRGRRYMVISEYQSPQSVKFWRTLDLATNVLQSYAGTFSAADSSLRIMLNDGQLIAETGSTSLKLHAVDTDLFFVPGVPVQLRFSSDGDEVVLTRDGEESRFTRM